MCIVKSELPTDIELETVQLMELSCLFEGIYVKTKETSENTDLDMPEILGIIMPCSTYRVSW